MRQHISLPHTPEILDGFKEIAEIIENRMHESANFESFDTICRQVSNRIPNMKEFAEKHDLIFFIAGEKSSNGKLLFAECKKNNPKKHNGIYCYVMDWETNKKVKFVNLLKGK